MAAAQCPVGVDARGCRRSWYLYTVGKKPPDEPADATCVEAFVTDMDKLLREGNQEEYYGIELLMWGLSRVIAAILPVSERYGTSLDGRWLRRQSGSPDGFIVAR